MANLTQLKILENLNGVLLVDKPEGIAFSTVVKAVKRKFNLVRVGHGGSLDAMASGLFIVLLNDANKFAERLMNADRVFSGSFKWGGTTDTGDKYGRAIERTPSLKSDDVKGDLFQTEPAFCSVRKEGSASYEIAETGAHDPFLTHVYRFETREDGSFTLSAAKGFLPRALAQDLGATLISLRREKIGAVDVARAIPFAKILETEAGEFPSLVLPVSHILG